MAMANVDFYAGRHASPEGTIDEIHSWFGQYWRLDMNHQYIQWLFPNKFVSQFNANCHSLTDAEARVFRSSWEIGERYAQSYRMFMDFLGLEVTDWATGDLRVVSAERLYNALVMYSHNQLRIRRVLASLAAVGFQRYMKPLVLLLQGEMHCGSLKELKTDDSTWALDDAPWEVYGKYVNEDARTFFQNTQVQWTDAQEESEWLKQCKAGRHPRGPMCRQDAPTATAPSPAVAAPCARAAPVCQEDAPAAAVPSPTPVAPCAGAAPAFWGAQDARQAVAAAVPAPAAPTPPTPAPKPAALLRPALPPWPAAAGVGHATPARELGLALPAPATAAAPWAGAVPPLWGTQALPQMGPLHAPAAAALAGPPPAVLQLPPRQPVAAAAGPGHAESPKELDRTRPAAAEAAAESSPSARATSGRRQPQATGTSTASGSKIMSVICGVFGYFCSRGCADQETEIIMEAQPSH